MQNETFRLIVRRGPQPNQVYDLTGDVSNLGRDITNDIVVNDREVSRHHLRLTRGADGYTIEDLGSTNGTFVNGKRVSGATALRNGDMVGLGETVTLQFEAARPGAPVSSPPPAEQQQTMQSPSNTDDARFAPPPSSQEAAAPAQQQAPAANPYAPPQQDPAAGQQGAYAPPAAQQQQPYGQAPASAPQQQPYAQAPAQNPDAYAAPQDYYGNQAAAPASYGPPPPGYDYDPYDVNGQQGGIVWWQVGCLVILLFCCCATVGLALAVDTLCLYDDIPGLTALLDLLFNQAPTC